MAPVQTLSPASGLLQVDGVRLNAIDRTVQVLIFRPISPQMISATLANRNNAMDSPNRMIPAITVPTAPTPVQMA